MTFKQIHVYMNVYIWLNNSRLYERLYMPNNSRLYERLYRPNNSRLYERLYRPNNSRLYERLYMTKQFTFIWTFIYDQTIHVYMNVYIGQTIHVYMTKQFTFIWTFIYD